jgi:hypothetical protein
VCFFFFFLLLLLLRVNKKKLLEASVGGGTCLIAKTSNFFPLSTLENKRRSLRSYTKGNKEEESQPATNDDDLMCVVCAGALGGPFPRPGSSPGYLLFKELYYTSLSLLYKAHNPNII